MSKSDTQVYEEALDEMIATIVEGGDISPELRRVASLFALQRAGFTRIHLMELLTVAMERLARQQVLEHQPGRVGGSDGQYNSGVSTEL